MQQDQDAIRVFEIALVLLDAGAGEGAAEGDGEGGADELGEREVGDVRELILQLGFPIGVGSCAEDVYQRPSGVAGRLDDPPQPLAMRVLDDHAVRRRQIDLEEGVTSLRVRQRDRQPVVVETPPEGTVLDEELDWERGGEDLMQRADQEFVLADRETLHN